MLLKSFQSNKNSCVAASEISNQFPNSSMVIELKRTQIIIKYVKKNIFVVG